MIGGGHNLSQNAFDVGEPSKIPQPMAKRQLLAAKRLQVQIAGQSVPQPKDAKKPDTKQKDDQQAKKKDKKDPKQKQDQKAKDKKDAKQKQDQKAKQKDKKDAKKKQDQKAKQKDKKGKSKKTKAKAAGPLGQIMKAFLQARKG